MDSARHSEHDFMRKVIAWLGLCLFLIPAIAHPQGTAQLSLEEVLASYRAARMQLHSLRTHFRQTTIFTLFEEEEISTGILFYKKPGRILWQFAEPDSSTTVINGDESWSIFPDIKQVQKFRLGASSVKKVLVIIGFESGETRLTDAFEISLMSQEGELILLHLIPTDEEITPYFSEIELTLSCKDFLPRKISFTETSADLIILELRELQRKAEIGDELFEYEIPEGFEVVEY